MSVSKVGALYRDSRTRNRKGRSRVTLVRERSVVVAASDTEESIKTVDSWVLAVGRGSEELKRLSWRHHERRCVRPGPRRGGRTSNLIWSNIWSSSWHRETSLLVLLE